MPSNRIVGYFDGSRAWAFSSIPSRSSTAWPISCASATTTAPSPYFARSPGTSWVRSQTTLSSWGQ